MFLPLLLCHCICFPTPTRLPTSAVIGPCPDLSLLPHRHLHNNRIQHLGAHSFEGLHSLETL